MKKKQEKKRRGEKAEAGNDEVIHPGTAQLRRALAACFFGWVLPGGGHWFLGRRKRAVLFLAVVLCLLFLGVFSDGKIYQVEQGKPLTILATFASMGNGPLHFVLQLGSWNRHGRGDNRSPYFELGNTFILVAGLLNMLIILDAYDLGVGLKD